MRELERAAAGGDADARLRLDALRCKIGQHDYRCDRLCSQCQGQRPGLPFLEAMIAGKGEGAIGWMKGHPLAVAHGTMKGLPKLARKQGPVTVQFYPSPGRYINGRWTWALTREEWDAPSSRHPIAWNRLGRRCSREESGPDDLGYYTYRTLPFTPRQLIEKLTWEAFCTRCHGRGYMTSHERRMEELMYPCEGCALELAQWMIDENTKVRARLEESRR